MANKSDLFLGFDLSTQQLKVIVTDGSLNHLDTFAVEFDQQFATKYGIKKGVVTNDETGEIVSPVAMWLDAIEFIFDKMKRENFPFEKVRGISGSAQQHGSVFWSKKAEDLLNNLNPNQELSEQLANAFTYKYSPNWQDHSTGKEIKDFEKVAGGPDDLAEITGSRAHYRFTGLQIRKMATRSNPQVYHDTERISLVSSFAASILLGTITNIEEADGCGMNLYDISKKEYNKELIELAAGVHRELDGVTDDQQREQGAQDLIHKLGPLQPISHKAVGTISSFFVSKYGFQENCKIFPFTGDNLATILSLPLGENDVLVSLGTSTTVLLVTKNYCPSQQYHLFKHPTLPDHYMGMICYCNGSLAREKIRDKISSDGSWDKFNEILDESESFNNKLGIYFPLGEIVPNAAPQIKRSEWKDHKLVDIDEADPKMDVSSIVESQTLSCRLRLGPMLASEESRNVDNNSGRENNDIYDKLINEFGTISTDGKNQTKASLLARPHKIYYVGGASRNDSIVKKMASIFGSIEGDYKVEIPNACALGGAFKASWGTYCEDSNKIIEFDKYINDNFDFSSVDKIQVKSRWEEYFPGIGMLAKMEAQLKHE